MDILHIATGAELLILRGEPDGLGATPRGVTWSPDGHRILVSSGSSLKLLDGTPLGR